ncbi:hypothetical protein [Fontivita pretiosa]|uniref:hypothetical protein n=1 Tax=Fontivita pretiosa TaxID=2989684 RepID=UPI003D174B70
MTSGSDATSEPLPRRRPRPRLLRWRRRILIALLVLPLLLLASVQAILWSNLPRRLVIAQVQRELKLRVAAKSFSTGWLGRSVLRDVTVWLPLAEEALLDVPELRVRHTGLIPLLLGRSLEIRRLEFDSPVLHVRQDQSGRWNVQEAIRRAASRRSGGTEDRPRRAAVSIPELVITDAKLYLADSREHITVVEPLTFKGWQSGPLVYEFDLSLPGPGKIVGQLSPTVGWEHQARFALRDTQRIAGSLAEHWPRGLSADGVWRGRVNSEGIEGRLELTSLKAADLAARGSALVGWADATLHVRPDALEVHATSSPGTPPIRLVSGLFRLDGSGVRGDDLLVAIGDGQATVSGVWNRADASATLRARWRDVALPAEFSHSGTLQASLRTPWPNRSQITASIDLASRHDAGSLAAAIQLQGQGQSFRNIDWTATFEKLTLSGRRRHLELQQLVARLRSGPQRITLDELRLPGDQASGLAGRGQLDLARQQWWLWLNGEQFPLRGAEVQTLAFNCNLWGSHGYVQLHELYLRAGDLQINGQGFYDNRLPRPLHVEVGLSHASPPGMELSPLIQGWLAGQVKLVGTISPMELELDGQLQASELRLGGREVGQIRAQLAGRIRPDGAEVATRELEMLGGRWRLSGEWPGDAAQPPRLRIEVRDLPAAEVAQVTGLQGLGGGSLTAQASLDIPALGLRAVQGVGQLHATNLRYRDFVADRATAQMRLHDGVLRVEPVELWQGDGQVRAGLTLALWRPEQVAIEVQAQRWPVQAEGQAARAVVDGHAKLLMDARQKQATGPLRLSADLTARQQPLGTLRVDAELSGSTARATQIQAQVLGGMVQGWLAWNWQDPIDGTAGQIRWDGLDLSGLGEWFPRLKDLRGRLSGSTSLAAADSRHALGPLRLELAGDVADGQLGAMRIRGLHATVFFDRDRVVTDGTQFDLADGTVHLFARATRRRGDDAATALLAVRLEGLDLNQVVHAFAPEAEPMAGRLAGSITIAGDPRNRDSLFGDVEAVLSESELINFDPVGVLYDLMRIGRSAGEGKPTGTARIQARLERSTLGITAARIYNRGVYIRAAGEIRDVWNIPDSPIEGSAVGSARPLSELKLPFMADVDQILGVLQANVTPVTIGGTLRRPIVKPATFGELGQTMRKLLLGDVREETRPTVAE